MWGRSSIGNKTKFHTSLFPSKLFTRARFIVLSFGSHDWSASPSFWVFLSFLFSFLCFFALCFFCFLSFLSLRFSFFLAFLVAVSLCSPLWVSPGVLQNILYASAR